jgi:hypothetical protein
MITQHLKHAWPCGCSPCVSFRRDVRVTFPLLQQLESEVNGWWRALNLLENIYSQGQFSITIANGMDIYIIMTWLHGHHQNVSVEQGGASRKFTYGLPFKPFKNNFNSHYKVLCLYIKTQMVQQTVIRVLWNYYLVHFLPFSFISWLSEWIQLDRSSCLACALRCDIIQYYTSLFLNRWAAKFSKFKNGILLASQLWNLGFLGIGMDELLNDCKHMNQKSKR